MEVKKLIIQNRIEQLDLLQKFVEEAGEEWALDPRLVFEINLVLEEYISNLVCYAYKDSLEHKIAIEISFEKSEITMTVTDDGNSFNILDMPATDQIGKPLAERKIGGLGIQFIKSLTDRIIYQTDNGINKLVIEKKLS